MLFRIIAIDGIEKTRKELLASYLTMLENYAYTINVRGILTQLVYNDKFNRQNTYRLPYKPLIVFLDVNNTDHKVRCKVNNEPTINIVKDRLVYNAYIDQLESDGITVLKYQTSELTPYSIAKDVLDYLKSISANDFVLPEVLTYKSLNLYTKEALLTEDIYYDFNQK